jgi:hypothetical protein
MRRVLTRALWRPALTGRQCSTGGDDPVTLLKLQNERLESGTAMLQEQIKNVLAETKVLQEQITILQSEKSIFHKDKENLQKDKDNLQKDKDFLRLERSKLIATYEKKIGEYPVQLGLQSLREIVAGLIHAVYNELCKIDPLPPAIGPKWRTVIYTLSMREKFISENAAVLLDKCAKSLGSREISVLMVYSQAEPGVCVYGKLSQFHHGLDLGRTIEDFRRSVPTIHDKPVEDILMGLLYVLEGLENRSVFLEFEEAPDYTTVTDINRTLIDGKLPRNADGIKKAALVLFSQRLKNKGITRLLVYPPEDTEPVKDISADLKESSYIKPYRLVIRDEPH